MWCKITKDFINKSLGVTSKLSQLDNIREKRAGSK